MRCLTVVSCLVACGDNRAPDEPDTTPTATVRVLAFNDFHGAVAPSLAAPGAAAFAGQLALLRSPDTIVIAAGDLIGASPLESGLFHDEPTIEAMNTLDLDAVGVGNHEFDEGVPELLRMQTGGCHPVDGCPSPTALHRSFDPLEEVARSSHEERAPLPAVAARSFVRTARPRARRAPGARTNRRRRPH